jgi:uncharacterized protein (UPF0333 family)
LQRRIEQTGAIVMLTRQATKDLESAAKGSRRGVTAMEYLMMISLIIVVCLIAIGYLGSANNTNISSSATSISNAVKKGG